MVSFIAEAIGLRVSQLRLLILLIAALLLILTHSLGQSTRLAFASVTMTTQIGRVLPEIVPLQDHEVIFSSDFGNSHGWYALNKNEQSNWRIINGALRMLPTNNGATNYAIAVAPIAISHGNLITIRADLKRFAGEELEVGFSLMSEDGTVLKTEKRCPTTIDGTYVVDFDLSDVDMAHDNSGMLAVYAYNWSEKGYPAIVEFDNVQVSAAF